MSTREDILARVRENRPAGDYPIPLVPRFPLPHTEDRIATFADSLAKMGGNMWSPGVGEDLVGFLRTHFAQAQTICSAVTEIPGNRDLALVREPRDLADVDVAIVRAVLGVAETGSVLFTESELQVNTLAYLAQHLVVSLSPAAIVSGDIEGVLIHGAQGVRSLTVIMNH